MATKFEEKKRREKKKEEKTWDLCAGHIENWASLSWSLNTAWSQSFGIVLFSPRYQFPQATAEKFQAGQFQEQEAESLFQSQLLFLQQRFCVNKSLRLSQLKKGNRVAVGDWDGR